MKGEIYCVGSVIINHVPHADQTLQSCSFLAALMLPFTGRAENVFLVKVTCQQKPDWKLCFLRGLFSLLFKFETVHLKSYTLSYFYC